MEELRNAAEHGGVVSHVVQARGHIDCDFAAHEDRDAEPVARDRRRCLKVQVRIQDVLDCTDDTAHRRHLCAQCRHLFLQPYGQTQLWQILHACAACEHMHAQRVTHTVSRCGGVGDWFAAALLTQ